MSPKNWAAALVAAATVGAPVFAVAAPNVLYRNDYTLGTDYLGAALAASGDAVTSTSGSIASQDLSAYNVVVYANQDLSLPAGDLSALTSFVQGGGYVIFADWTQNSLGGVGFTGNRNLHGLTVGSQFSAGLTNPLSVNNTGWGTYSYGLQAGSGNQVAGTFSNGDAAIVIADGGHVIYNGFLSDTVASTMLYSNELSSLGVSAVPEPMNLGLMFAGLGVVGLAARRRKSS